jgi:hypothetical protein
MGGAVTRRFQPIPAQAGRYRKLMEIYRPLHPGLRDTYQALAEFCRNG